MRSEKENRMAVHQFQPARYHVTLGSHEPALRIASGDSVVTKTVDAGGHDENGEAVAGWPNAQTGPFYVEDAEPGDTLAVRLERLAPNRRRGYTASLLAPNVIDPHYVRELPTEPIRAWWEIDRDAWTATLAEPETKLGRYAIPLDPMLGCFGVAPADGQAISAATSGPHGGNMDYRGFRQGATVYFPVFVPGALLHVGDGHAVQGDGEIVGTGIEISFDVTFSVRLIKGRTIRWPRGENEDYLFAVGNARPLDQALQHATTEMMRWLRDDLGLDPYGASLLLGQCVEYDLGNVFDPAYTMVCKLRKSALSKLGVRASFD
jgi:acetamidase/formamidase